MNCIVRPLRTQKSAGLRNSFHLHKIAENLGLVSKSMRPKLGRKSYFTPLDLRTKEEAGHMWENFMIAERMKINQYGRKYTKCYFWRTEQHKEVDLIEELDGRLNAFEFKWDPNKKVKIPAQFTAAYPDAVFKSVSPKNAAEFLIG